MKSDIIIVGGGVIGTSIAYYLSKAGKSVTLFEKEDHTSGATGSCDQQIILQSKNPGIHLELALKSAELYKTLSDELDCELLYENHGGMITIENEEEMSVMKDFVKRQKELGLIVDILDRDEAIKLQPGLAEHILGATYSPQDAHVNPFNLNMAFAKRAKENGCNIHLHTGVDSLIIEDDCIKGVKTDKGDFFADIVINAAGPWASQIVKDLELNIPIKPRRGQIIISEPVDKYITKNILSGSYIVAKYNADKLKDSNDPFVKLGIGLSLTQTDKGNILIGATREFVGYDTSNTREGVRAILKNATRLFPELQELDVIRVMAGIRPFTPDGLPLIGFTDKYKNLFMAAGHEGDGIALAPITGKLVSDMICKGETDIDIDALSPNRFT